jgi:hypothetical protein
MLGAQLDAQATLFRSSGRREYAAPERTSELDRGHSDSTTAALHQKRFAGL